MRGKIFTYIIIAVALMMAIFASFLPPERLDSIILVSRFFDIMLPVLAVGALIKYIAGCGSSKKCCNKDDQKM